LFRSAEYNYLYITLKMLQICRENDKSELRKLHSAQLSLQNLKKWLTVQSSVCIKFIFQAIPTLLLGTEFENVF